MAQQYGLGRGLASLIPPKKEEANGGDRAVIASGHLEPRSKQNSGNDQAPASRTQVHEVALSAIVPNPHQPRLHFDEAKLAELAQSIQEHGILQPLIVTETKPGQYELIAGERRFQAAKKIGLATVPILVRAADERVKLELAIIENIQRHNLNPIEEAKAYFRLADEFGLSQEAVAAKMGKQRSTIANTLRLLQLPVEIQRAVAEGKISEGHAKALLSIENKEKQRAVFDLIIKEELTVRETEERVRSTVVKAHVRTQRSIDPAIQEAVEALSKSFGTRVKIQPGSKGGKLIFEYFSKEELDALLRKLAS